jgi:MoaA/NifB/PqqE/SkfB family radical SAM enzyme
MTLWLDRLTVLLRSLRYRDAWTLRPRQSMAMLRYLRHCRPTWRGGQAELNVYSPPVGSPAYSRYLRGLRRMGQGQWTPLVAHVSVTDRCPYHCRRCSNVARGDADPTTATLLHVIEELRRAGTCRVAFTGGEPLLRDDLHEVLAACGPKLSSVLFTSGYKLDANRARTLQRAGLAAAFISLDHFLPDEHNRTRGQPGAFQQALDAIRACRTAGIYTAVQSVVMPSLLENGQLDEFLAFCKTLQVDEVMLLEEVPIGGCGATSAEDGSLREKLAAAQLRSARDATMLKVSSMSWLESPQCLGCQAGFSFLYITAQGDVAPCDFVPLSFGNVHEMGIQAIHDRMLALLKRPSSNCLARRMQIRYGTQRDWPVCWQDVQSLLHDYDPGPSPELLRYLCNGRHP